MNLGELCSELRDGILNDRGTSTGDDDKLWSDATLIRYINEAQRRFAVRSYTIRDASTPEVVNVTLQAGVADYDLHPAIIGVVSARIVGNSTDLTRIGHSIFNVNTPVSDVAYYAQSLDTANPGRPVAYLTDEGLAEDDDGSRSALTMHIYPVPRADDAGSIIKLRVVRKPLDELTASNMSAVPEIPADYHLDMLDWAAYLALRIMDEDAGNQAAADKFAARFEAHVQDAKKLVLRKLASPQPWGFGRGGFVWGA